LVNDMRPQCQGSAGFHGITSVLQEVPEAKENMGRIELHDERTRGKLAGDGDAVRRAWEGVRDGLLHQSVEIDGAALRRMLVREKLELAHDVRTALSRLENRRRGATDASGRIGVITEQATVPEDDGEQIIEIVRDAAGERSQTLQASRFLTKGIGRVASPDIVQRQELPWLGPDRNGAEGELEDFGLSGGGWERDGERCGSGGSARSDGQRGGNLLEWRLALERLGSNTHAVSEGAVCHAQMAGGIHQCESDGNLQVESRQGAWQRVGRRRRRGARRCNRRRRGGCFDGLLTTDHPSAVGQEAAFIGERYHVQRNPPSPVGCRREAKGRGVGEPDIHCLAYLLAVRLVDEAIVEGG
jgi:hypothetical protein